MPPLRVRLGASTADGRAPLVPQVHVQVRPGSIVVDVQIETATPEASGFSDDAVKDALSAAASAVGSVWFCKLIENCVEDPLVDRPLVTASSSPGCLRTKGNIAFPSQKSARELIIVPLPL